MIFLLFGSGPNGQIVGLSLVLLGDTWGEEHSGSKMVQDGPKNRDPNQK